MKKKKEFNQEVMLISQYAVFENISDDDVDRINDEQPLISSTPLKNIDPDEIEDEDEDGLIPDKITSKLSNVTSHAIKSAGPLNSDFVNDNNNNKNNNNHDNENDNTNSSPEIYKNIDYNDQSSPIDSAIAGINGTLDNTYNEDTMDSHLRNKEKNKMNNKPLSAIMSMNYDNSNNKNNDNNII
ncbi:unnamed protein product [[Candida] boidinii]|nr:unnamed protein product [[Candida] boidinii]